jgi:hypothetical protein
MSPREVGALQSIAKQHGTTLTVNPQTGLPEAGILDAILPAVAGAGLSLIPGVGPLMAAGIVGGGTALLTKDLNKGLMAGLGAFGGASLAGSIAGAGAGAGSTAAAAETAAAAGSLYTPAEIASMQAAGLSPAEIATSAADYVGGASGVGTANMPFSQATQSALNSPMSAGLSEISKAPGAFFKKNMFPIGAAAAPLLLGGGDLFGGGEKKEEASNSYIRPYTYSQTRNSNYTGAGTPYFSQSMTPQTPIPASDFGGTAFAGGGIVALADGGISAYNALSLRDSQDYRVPELMPVQAATYAQNVRPTAPEVTAYNQQMMGRANQQYNINPLPAALQVAGFDKPGGNSDTDWLNQQYQQAFGRDAEAGGRQTWEQALAAGKTKEDIFNEGILGSSEYKQQQANLAAGRTAYTNADGSHMYQDLVAAGQFNPNRRAPVAPITAAPATTAPASSPTGGFGYDPSSRRYIGGAPTAPTAAEQSEVEKLRAEMDAMREPQNYNWAAGDGGGMASGGITNSKMAQVEQYLAKAQSGQKGMQEVMSLAKAGDYNAAIALNKIGGDPNQNYAMGGGIASLGSYSDGGRMLKGPGDGVSDSIPATIGGRQPARLATEEFVIPARIVSELGNGSSEAGAKRLYGMMERVEQARENSVGKGKIAVDTKAYKHLPV